MEEKKKSKKYGQVVKLRFETYNMLKKKKRKKETFNDLLVRLLALTDKAEEYWLVRNPEPTVFRKKSDARGEAMIRARMNGKKKAERVVKVKEVS